jgi:hypothetical protein
MSDFELPRVNNPQLTGIERLVLENHSKNDRLFSNKNVFLEIRPVLRTILVCRIFILLWYTETGDLQARTSANCGATRLASLWDLWEED